MKRINIAILTVSLLIVGCATKPQIVAFKATGVVSVTAETAIKEYNEYAALGHTTIAENVQVKAAYIKYQAAFGVVCDTGAIFAASSVTNMTMLNEATSNVSQSLTDLKNLITSFGVKLQ